MPQRKRRFCTICGARAVDDSGLCREHYAQAARFSQSFGLGSSPDEVEPSPVEPDAFEQVLDLGWRELCAWVADHFTSGRRWPQLVFYVLRGQLRVRHYYGVIPETAIAEIAFADLKSSLDAEMAPGGGIFSALRDAYRQRREALESGHLQMLCVDFLTHRQEVVIGERTADDRRQTLMTCPVLDSDRV